MISDAIKWICIVAGVALLILLLTAGAAWAGRNTDREEHDS